MLKIRLQRTGKKNTPSYRVVLVEHTAPPQGKFQEILGFYNPRKKQKSFKKERIEHWLSKGAQPSPTVHNLLVDEGIFKEPKLKAWSPKRKRSEAKSSEALSEAKSEGGKEETPKEEVKVEEDKEVKAEEAKAEEKPIEEPKEEIEEVKPKEKPKNT